MIIIVEGIDRVGKTTLCEKLSNELKLPIYKHVGNFKYHNMDNDNETDKMLQILQICKLSNSFIIFDRFHFTDYVYGNLERNYNPTIAAKNLNQIENFINEIVKEAILLFVIPTDIDESSKQHGKDLSKYQKLFEEIYKESKIRYKYRCTYNTINEAICFVKEVLSKEGD